MRAALALLVFSSGVLCACAGPQPSADDRPDLVTGSRIPKRYPGEGPSGVQVVKPTASDTAAGIASPEPSGSRPQ